MAANSSMETEVDANLTRIEVELTSLELSSLELSSFDGSDHANDKYNDNDEGVDAESRGFLIKESDATGLKNETYGSNATNSSNDNISSTTYYWFSSLSPQLLHNNCRYFIDNNYDLAILFGIKGLRMFSFGFLGLMLVIFLRALNFSYDSIGSIFFWTLLGDCVISLYLTSRADLFGRKNTLLVGSALSIITSIVFALSSNYYVIIVASIFGVISPSGGDVGPFMAVELSALSQLSDEAERTMLIAYYNLVGSFSVAVGAIVCGAVMGLTSFLISLISNSGEIDNNNNNDNNTSNDNLLISCRGALCIYACIQVAILGLVYKLSNDIEVPDKANVVIKEINPSILFIGLEKSKTIIFKLSVLFLIDSFAGSFIMQSLISNWFKSTYDTSLSKLGTVLFVCNLFAAISSLLAAKLAEKIGLIMTMFATHMPSNVLSILVPLMPDESSAIIILCLRYSISQMDVPTRNAYVQNVVDSQERSAANGLLNVVRTLGTAIGPYCAAHLYERASTRDYPFYIAGALKIVYDCLLVYSMNEVRPTR
jgi:MFS family permease